MFLFVTSIDIFIPGSNFSEHSKYIPRCKMPIPIFNCFGNIVFSDGKNSNSTIKEESTGNAPKQSQTPVFQSNWFISAV